MNTLELGLCECGCGGITKISDRTCLEKGWVRGVHHRFINHHHDKADNHYKWRGGRCTGMGYEYLYRPEHPRADNRGYVAEHILVVESVIGRFLPASCIVHHINEIKNDNRKENLVVCENRAYHNLLHQRINAKKACEHTDWRKCYICKQYDMPENIIFFLNQTSGHHRLCYNNMRYKQYEQKRRYKNGTF